MKSKPKNLHFPRNYRRITENKNFLHVFKILKKMTIIFVFAAIIIFIIGISYDLYRNFALNQQIQLQRQKLNREINLWESFLEKYKNYKEVYFQIAAREYELKNFDKAKQYLQKAFLIDPNYEEGLRLQKELENK